MKKNLIKIIGIILLSGISKNLSEHEFSYSDKINNSSVIQKELSKSKRLSFYRQEIIEINEEIDLLNRKINFYLERINNKNYPLKIKKAYLNELKNYKNQKDSIYDLTKN